MNDKRDTVNELYSELKILEEALTNFKKGTFLDTIAILRSVLNDNDIDYFKTLILQDIDKNNDLNLSKGFLQLQINDTKNLINNTPLWMII